jgi:TRAP-type mannitol/chloroaromatic compound transport system permease large subunit
MIDSSIFISIIIRPEVMASQVYEARRDTLFLYQPKKRNERNNRPKVNIITTNRIVLLPAMKLSSLLLGALALTMSTATAKKSSGPTGGFLAARKGTVYAYECFSPGCEMKADYLKLSSRQPRLMVCKHQANG